MLAAGLTTLGLPVCDTSNTASPRSVIPSERNRKMPSIPANPLASAMVVLVYLEPGRPHGVQVVDALLQRREGQQSDCFIIGPGKQLAVDHGAFRQARRHRLDFREAAVESFLATGPQGHGTVTLEQLQANTIPFPFHEPIFDPAIAGRG